MTTNVSRILSENLYIENDSLIFNPQQFGIQSEPLPPVGAVTFIAQRDDSSQSLQDLAVACGREAFTLSRLSCNKSYKRWLFVSDGPWKESTRIVRHQKLWKNHRDLIESGFGGQKSDEVAIEIAGKVRYCGLLEISDGLIDKAIYSARVNPSFAIILSDRREITTTESIQNIFYRAFTLNSTTTQTHVNWPYLSAYLCPLGDTLMRVSGLFDDREAAVDLIADPNNLPKFT